MTNIPLVTVCMSTYNGSKYLSEQIDSIIDQTYDNWQLYIHDDGSTDKTVEIINSYQVKDDRIHFVKGNNHQGIIKAFINLVYNVKSDYYMFSDQDDVWLENKFSTMVNKANSHDNEKPLLLHTRFKKIDGNGIVIDDGDYEVNSRTDFKFFAIANNVTGCTTLFNSALRDKLIENDNENKINYDRLFMHDWWLGVIASAFGEVCYLDEKPVLYRQHENNVLGAQKKFSFEKIWNKVTLKTKLEIFKICTQTSEFKKLYGSQLGSSKLELVTMISSLLTSWNPIKQLNFIKRNKVTMLTKSHTIQLYIFVMLPVSLRKTLF